MDFETLLWLFLAFIYFVFQALGARRKTTREDRTPPPPEATPHEAPAGGMEDFDDALREIREALGQRERPAPAPAPAPVPPPRSTALPPRKPASLEAPRRAAVRTKLEEFRTSEAAATRPRKKIRQIEVKDVERVPPSPRGLPATGAISPDDPYGSARVTKPPREEHTLLHRLREQKDAREAIVLREVLGPPRARRSR